MVYAGIYPSSMVDSAKGNFDRSSRTKEDFVKYAFARKKKARSSCCASVCSAQPRLSNFFGA